MFNSSGRRISALLAGFGLATFYFYKHTPSPTSPHNQTHTKSNEKDGKRKKVAVIGAGASGIVTTKWLAEAGHEVKTFELSDGIGGNWRYIEHGGDEHSSCYKNLSTITSARSMSFEGYPIPKSYGVYPRHTKILKYLTYYCDENQLWQHFHLKTNVTAVRPTEGGYNITYSSEGIEHTEPFDAVAICSGHNSQPYWPNELANELKNYSGTVMHSRSYRSPAQFNGKSVLILGGGVSGQQIAFDISHQANSVVVSSRRPINALDIYIGSRAPVWRSLSKLFGATVSVQPSISLHSLCNSVTFSNGSTLNFDAIIVCTGYQNLFTILDPSIVESIIRYPTGSTHPVHLFLYKQTFPITPSVSDYPTLAFIGMMDVYDTSMFPVADVQAKWFAALLSERARLPPRSQIDQEMKEWIKSINHFYHPMTIHSPSLFRDSVHSLIKENET